MSIKPRLRFQVLTRDNYACRYCGAFAPTAVLVVDHVVPKSKGGQDVLENLVTACEPCNSGKSDLDAPPGVLAGVEAGSDEFRRRRSEPSEDDLAEMEMYQDSFYALAALPAGEVLHWIARANIAAGAYRPTHAELIIAAGGMAQRAQKGALA